MNCSACGTDHDGHEPGSFGAEIRCVQAQAENAGLTHLVDQADALRRTVDERRDEALRSHFLVPHEWENPRVDGNPMLRCRTCGQVWYPYETERQQGECRGPIDDRRDVGAS